MSAKGLSLIYVIGTYPLLTTTFIDREVRILRQWGVDLQVVAIRRPPAGTPLSEDQRDLQRGVIYLLPVVLSSLVLSHLHFALAHPRRYFQALLHLVTRPHPSRCARLKTLLHFGEGVYAAYLLRGRQFLELHAHFVDRAATVALVASRLLGKPYSLSVHAGADIFTNPVLLREKIMEARQVVTCTLYNKDHVQALAGDDLAPKIRQVYHGLDLARYRPSRARANGRPLVLSVGQLAERKGFVQLIRACRDLKDRGYDFRCEIVGGGPQHQELETLIAELSLQDTVSLSGALPHDTVIERYRDANMFVLPCTRSRDGNMDGVPNVLAEAMAMQVPVISTSVSAIAELVRNQVNGLVVPPDDHAALVAAMASLLDRPRLRDELGRKGRQSVLETFDVEANMRRFATILWPVWLS